MLENGVGLLSGRWSLVEGWSAFFGFVDHAETGYVPAEGWDGVIWVECVGNGCVASCRRVSPARITLLARAPFALRKGRIGV